MARLRTTRLSSVPVSAPETRTPIVPDAGSHGRVYCATCTPSTYTVTCWPATSMRKWNCSPGEGARRQRDRAVSGPSAVVEPERPERVLPGGELERRAVVAALPERHPRACWRSSRRPRGCSPSTRTPAPGRGSHRRRRPRRCRPSRAARAARPCSCRCQHPATDPRGRGRARGGGHDDHETGDEQCGQREQRGERGREASDGRSMRGAFHWVDRGVLPPDGGSGAADAAAWATWPRHRAGSRVAHDDAVLALSDHDRRDAPCRARASPSARPCRRPRSAPCRWP